MTVPRYGSPTVVKLVALLRGAGFTVPGGPDDWCVCRTHAGSIQRAQGAWSWTLQARAWSDVGVTLAGATALRLPPEGWRALDVGGYYAARDCARPGPREMDRWGSDAACTVNRFGAITIHPPEAWLQARAEARARPPKPRISREA